MTEKIGYILVGISGSGKSTKVAELQRVHGDRRVGVLSMDQIRLDLFGEYAQKKGIPVTYDAAWKWCVENDTSFKYRMNAEWKSVLEKNDVVIVDNMNHVRKARTRWVQDLRSKGFSVNAIQFMVPLDVLIARQMTRGDKYLPPDLVRQLFMQFQELQVDEYDTLSFV